MRAQFCLARELKRVSSENEGGERGGPNPGKLVPPVKLQINPFSPRGITIRRSKFLPLFLEGIKRAEIFGFGSSAGEERKEEKKKERETRNSEKERKRGGRLSSGVNLGQIENSRGSTAQFVFLRLPGKMGGKKGEGEGRRDRWSIRFQNIGKRALSSPFSTPSVDKQ